LVEQAEVLFAELIASMGKPVLLHGDLHHFNILTAEREPWLAIDPKGIVGEPAYEVGALLRNPNQAIATNPKILARRIDQLSAELTIDRARIIGWGLAQAVLSGWWDYEDLGYGWEPMIELAARFDQLQ
jgi:streptomycin 6-kinase